MGQFWRRRWPGRLVLIGLVLAQGAIAIPSPARAQADNSATMSSSLPHDATHVRPLGLTLTRSPTGAGDGVEIAEVDPSSDAAYRGIEASDVILNAGSEPVSTPEELAKAVKHAIDHGYRAILLHIKSGHQRRIVAVRLHTVEIAPSSENSTTGRSEEDSETRPDITDLLRELPIGQAPRADKKNPLDQLEKLKQATKRLHGEPAEAGLGSAALNKAWLGVRLRDITGDDIWSLKLSSKNGTVITGVTPDSPAAAADLQQDDVLVRLEAPPVRQNAVVVDVSGEIRNAKDFSDRIATLPPATTVTLHLLREGRPREISATLSAIPTLLSFQALIQRAEKLFEEGKYGEAEPLYKEVLSVSEKLFGADDQLLGRVLNKLGAVYYFQERYWEAEPLAVRALTIAEKQKGPDHPDLLTEVGNLATVYVHLERYDAAEPLYRRLIALSENVRGPDHPEVARHLEDLAGVYVRQRRHGEAEPLLKRALAIREKAHGPDHPFVATILTRLGAVYRELGDRVEAEIALKRALDIGVKKFIPTSNRSPDMDPAVAESLRQLAILRGEPGDGFSKLIEERNRLFNEKKSSENEGVSKRIVSYLENLLGTEHAVLAWHIEWLGAMYAFDDDLARPEEGFRLLKRALVIAEKVYGPDHPAVGGYLGRLAHRYHAHGMHAKAEPLYQRALAIADNVDRRNTSVGDIGHDKRDPDQKITFSKVADPKPEDHSADILHWQSIKDTSSPEEIRSYLAKFPDGLFADLARLRIARFDKDLAAPSPNNGAVARGDATSDPGESSKGKKAVTVIIDPIGSRKLEVSCGAVIEEPYKGNTKRICSNAEVREFVVKLADGTEAQCDGKERFAIYMGGHLLACRLKRPLIIVTDNAIERCRDTVVLTETGEFSRCISDEN